MVRGGISSTPKANPPNFAAECSPSRSGNSRKARAIEDWAHEAGDQFSLDTEGGSRETGNAIQSRISLSDTLKHNLSGMGMANLNTKESEGISNGHLQITLP
eukprot:4542340-Amphidinium_carterae.1